VAPELGSERRETVRFLSTVNVLKLKGSNPSTKGLEKGYHWCIGCRCNCI